MTRNVTARMLKVVCDTPTRDVGHRPSPAGMRQSPTRQGPREKGLPEVKASNRMEAAVPLGDAESVERLRERTADAVLRAAGATTLLDANLPPHGGQQAAEPPAGDQPGGD